MYGKNDLRASLATSKEAARAPAVRTPFKSATYARFYDAPACDTDASGEAWYCRGQNMIVNYILARAGGRFSRIVQLDEYALLIPGTGMRVTITARGEEQTVVGPAVVFIPPGESRIEAKTDG